MERNFLFNIILWTNWKSLKMYLKTVAVATFFLLGLLNFGSGKSLFLNQTSDSNVFFLCDPDTSEVVTVKHWNHEDKDLVTI